jgi:hypothetical protein
MTQDRSFKLDRASVALISTVLLFVTLLTTAFASGSSVQEILSSSCDVPFRVSVSGSNPDEIAVEIDTRLAGELAAARCAVNELLSGAVFQGTAQDIRLAQELASVKSAAKELAFETASGIEQDARLALELVGAKGAVEALAFEAALGIALDFRAAQDLVAAKIAAAELARGQLSADQIARKILAQEAREAVMFAEILELQDGISLR